MRMISANVFRALPQSSCSDQPFEQEDDEAFFEASWPHLQIVYELLRKFVVSSDTDSKLARASISLEFVSGLVELFNSEDAREREYLKTIMHRIYGKVMPLRGSIRGCVMNVFHRVIYEGERFNGLAELLEILGSIINGFAVPLKEEHKDLLRKGLLPLHIPSCMPIYHVQLSFCIGQFVEKESGLATEVLRFLLRHWPATHSRKEVMLLNEVEEIVELTQAEDVGEVSKWLFRRIGRCIGSAHFQVAERALFYWNNEYMVSVMMHYREDVMEGVFGPLARNIASHWNANVHCLSCNVQGLLFEMDGGLFETSKARYEREAVEGRRREAERRVRWQKVCKMAELRSLRRQGGGKLKARDESGRSGEAADAMGTASRPRLLAEEHESEGIRKATRLVQLSDRNEGTRVTCSEIAR